MTKDVAIIGMAGRFPGARDLEQLYRLLREGQESVAEPSDERYLKGIFPLDPRRPIGMGLIDDVEMFDHKFFNISAREAQYMDPHQRIMLETAYHTVESAGYGAESLDGSNTGIYVTDGNYEYQHLFDKHESMMVSGNSPFSAAGLVSRFFNTRATAMLINTGCSSSLQGVRMACNDLALGQVDQVLLLSVRLALTAPIPSDFLDVGVTSFDGRTRTFNADSRGSGSSEAAAGLLLKPLEKALADDDIIYAVVRSTGSNSAGKTAGSLTATSAQGQSEAIVECWRSAGIDPASVDYIEAHGSGTYLGDPIEIGGIDQAFRQFTDEKGICAVSCIKTNIGHTDQVAGLAGLFKVVLSLRSRQLFASLHFDDPNPLIDFENSAAYVNAELRDWDVPAGQRRRAGVSSFGFAGNSTHALLEEAPPPPERSEPPCPTGRSLVALSSKTHEGLLENMRSLADFLEQARPAPRIEDVSHTLLRGRSHFKHRFSALVDGSLDLVRQLAQAQSASESRLSGSPALKKSLLVFSDSGAAASPPLEAFQRYPFFRRLWDSLPLAGGSGGRPLAHAEGSVAFQYCFFRLLECHGFTSENVLGLGSGDISVRWAMGEITAQQALREAAEYRPQSIENLPSRLERVIEAECESGRAAFVEMGPEGNISAGLRRIQAAGPEDEFCVITLDPQAEDGLLDILGRLYLEGAEIDWESFSHNRPGRRIPLPGYRFGRVRCWYREPCSEAEIEQWRQQRQALDQGASIEELIEAAKSEPQPLDTTPINEGFASAVAAQVEASWSDSQQRVARIWSQVLGADRIGLDDDFFALGGHSLFGVMVANRIERDWGVQLEFKDVMMFSTVRAMAEGIERILSSGRAGSRRRIEKAPPAEYYPLSSSQMRMWLQCQMEGGELAYNMPTAVEISGGLDPAQLKRALQSIFDRHEMLRTAVVEVEGRPMLRVADGVELPLEEYKAAPQEALRMFEDYERPFDLSQGPLMRFSLIRTGEERFLLIIDMHHIATDGTSFVNFCAELTHAYLGQELPPLNLQYKDYTYWQEGFLQSDGGIEQERYWLDLFPQRPEPLDLPSDFPRPEAWSFEAGFVNADLGLEATQALRELAQSNSATLYMALMSCYATLLYRYTGKEDIVVGMPVLGRPMADLEPLIGLFVNTLPLRSHPQRSKTFRQLLSEVKERCLEAFRNQDYPMERLIEKLGQHGEARHPLFDSTLVLQNLAPGEVLDLESDDLQMRPLEKDSPSAKFDLTLEFSERTDGLRLSIEYSAALFEHSTVEKLAQDLARIIESVCAQPDIELGEVDFGLVLQTSEEAVEDFDLSAF